ncbi:TPA: P27 family phage terminase small subunit [Streptococcus suis]
MKIGELKNELLNLINPDSHIELEKVERYINLVKIYKELDKTLKKDGYMIVVKNGAQSFLKANSAIGEKVKINQALIKLGEFFDKKQEERDAARKNTNFADPSEFL